MSNQNENKNRELEKEKEELEKEELENQKIIEIYELDQNKKFKKSIIVIIISIILLIGGLYSYRNTFIYNSKYAFKFDDTKIERVVVDELKDNFLSEEEVAYFIMDTLTYSNIAKEQGITVSQEEIDKVNEEFTVYREEIALSNKLLEIYKEKTENVTEEELKTLYEETKDLYVKKGTVKFLALNSESIINDNLVLSEEEIKKYPENTDTIENLIETGIYPNELLQDKFLLVDITNENDKQIYRYFYIYDKEISEYYNFEESKEYLKLEYDKAYGLTSILAQGNAKQQNTTIEYYN